MNTRYLLAKKRLLRAEGRSCGFRGQSLTPLLKDSKSPWSKPAISQVTRPPAPDPKTIGYSFRDERYRYTSWQGATAGEELYDYDADPEEKKNIAADPSMASVKTQLKQQLESVTANRGRKMELGAMLPPVRRETRDSHARSHNLGAVAGSPKADSGR